MHTGNTTCAHVCNMFFVGSSDVILDACQHGYQFYWLLGDKLVYSKLFGYLTIYITVFIGIAYNASESVQDVRGCTPRRRANVRPWQLPSN